MKNALESDLNALINTYKQAKQKTGQDEIICQSQGSNSIRELVVSSIAESIDMMKCFLPGFMTILGLVLAIPPVAQHYRLVFGIAALIIITAEIVFLLYSYLKYYKKIYKIKIKNKRQTIEIKIEDYIVNMLKLLLENKNRKNTRLLFAIGMNSTALEKIKADANSVNKDYFSSICHDFIEFADWVGINAIDKISEVLCQATMVPQRGSALMVDFEITNAPEDYSILNGSSFTVAFYVNSISKDGHFGVGHEDVENGQITVFNLIDNLSDYIYKVGKRSNKEFVLLIPAIGTGKYGNSPYKNVLIEIINCLSISSYQTPHKVVLSLRNLELFNNNYEVSSLLRLSKQILNRRKQ